jgi:hypothetical protein
MASIINQGARQGLLHKRVDAVEQTANGAVQLAKEALHIATAKQTAGRDGAPGAAGKSIVGPKGEQGPPGKDAVGIPGSTGQQGRPGRDCTCASTAAIEDARLELNIATTEIVGYRAELAELRFIVKSLLDSNKKGAEYVAFLQQRIAARVKQ